MARRKEHKKKPTQKVAPKDKRSPRGGKKAESTEKSCLVWHVETMDNDGPWSFKEIDPTTWWNILCQKKHEFSRMTWAEILGQRHHSIPVCDIIPEPQKRLAEIEQDDVDHLYSLALGGRLRLWGIRDRYYFKVLWWNPKHKICPASQKGT